VSSFAEPAPTVNTYALAHLNDPYEAAWRKRGDLVDLAELEHSDGAPGQAQRSVTDQGLWPFRQCGRTRLIGCGRLAEREQA
jgi:hypothetical protein